MGIHKLYHGDALERMKEIDSGIIALTVTSPPYFNAKNYSDNDSDVNIGKNKDYQQYLSRIKLYLKEIYRLTTEGGIVVWNTSPVIYKGQRFMIPQDTHNLFIKQGFVCRDDITWKKPDGAGRLRCGGWVQNKGKPLTWHPNIVDEKIMVYVKAGKREEGKFEEFSTYYQERPKDILTNVWLINPETSTHWHDAPFPYELVKRCIVLYSFKDDWVFDPFLGSGTTMRVARDLDRNSIGIELSEEYIRRAKEKLGFHQQTLTHNHTYEEL